MSEISKVDIIIKPERFSVFKEALKEVGILGMTVIHGEGCGLQGGRIEHYRGAEILIDLLPKTKVEIIVPRKKCKALSMWQKRYLKPARWATAKFLFTTYSRSFASATNQKDLTRWTLILKK